MLLKKRLWHRCFPVNFANFLRTPFSQNISSRLVLEKDISGEERSKKTALREIKVLFLQPQSLHLLYLLNLCNCVISSSVKLMFRFTSNCYFTFHQFGICIVFNPNLFT